VSLAVRPETVRVGTLVRRLEADQPVVECFRHEGCTCTLMSVCRLREMLREARDRFYDSLDGYTLVDCLLAARKTAAARR
jgi:Rrf2 family transcriptional regulator, nitric oxide-sensitive transcriptional repressor